MNIIVDIERSTIVQEAQRLESLPRLKSLALFVLATTLPRQFALCHNEEQPPSKTQLRT